MPSVQISKVGKVAIVECAGRFVRNGAAFKLRDAVTSQSDANTVVLDLTEMRALGGGGLGMLVSSAEMGLRSTMFDSSCSNPSERVRDKLNPR